MNDLLENNDNDCKPSKKVYVSYGQVYCSQFYQDIIISLDLKINKP